MKTKKEPTEHELDNLANITAKQAGGEKLNFHERNILKILTRRKQPTSYQATVHFALSPNNEPTFGPMKNRKTKNWATNFARKTINPKEWIFFEIWLVAPNKSKITPTPAQMNDIIYGKLKHGQRVKLFS